MPAQYSCASAAASFDLVAMIKSVTQASGAGLDGAFVAALVCELSQHLVPRIVPDRRYSIGEIAAFGFTRGAFYANHKSLIRKDGRKSYIVGSDLLALIHGTPRLGDAAALRVKVGDGQKKPVGTSTRVEPLDYPHPLPAD